MSGATITGLCSTPLPVYHPKNLVYYAHSPDLSRNGGLRSAVLPHKPCQPARNQGTIAILYGQLNGMLLPAPAPGRVFPPTFTHQGVTHPMIQPNDTVTLSFTGKLDTGEAFMIVSPDEPLTVTIGNLELPPSV